MNHREFIGYIKGYVKRKEDEGKYQAKMFGHLTACLMNMWKGKEGSAVTSDDLFNFNDKKSYNLTKDIGKAEIKKVKAKAKELNEIFDGD